MSDDMISTLAYQASIIAEQKKEIILLRDVVERIAKTNPHLFKTQEGMFNELQGIANLSNNVLNEIKEY